MSDLQKGTIRERLARLEVLMCNHISHHEKTEEQRKGDRRWLLRIGAIIIGGLAVQILPGLIKWLASVV